MRPALDLFKLRRSFGSRRGWPTKVFYAAIRKGPPDGWNNHVFSRWGSNPCSVITSASAIERAPDLQIASVSAAFDARTLLCRAQKFPAASAVTKWQALCSLAVRRPTVETSTLQYVEPVHIAGLPGKRLIVRVATGRVLGRLRGFIMDPMNQHLRYLVVHASGWFSKTTLVPAVSPRIDFDCRAIEIDVNDVELQTVHNFTRQKALTCGVCARATYSGAARKANN
jgi:hypothetical protein